MTSSPVSLIRSRVAPHVLVVDGHRLFAEVLARRLRRAPAIAWADVACSVQEARVTVEQRAPDVVVLNPDLEVESGLDLIRHLDALASRPRVVVVADRSDPSAVVKGLVLGVRGWVSKESPFDDLLHAIDAVQRGDLHLPTTAWGPVILELLTERSTRSAQETFIGRLTVRQAQILQHLIAGMTRAEIAKALGVSPHTVRTHVRDMFRIVGVHSTPHLVAQARAAGVAGAPARPGVAPSP